MIRQSLRNHPLLPYRRIYPLIWSRSQKSRHASTQDFYYFGDSSAKRSYYVTSSIVITHQSSIVRSCFVISLVISVNSTQATGRTSLARIRVFANRMLRIGLGAVISSTLSPPNPSFHNLIHRLEPLLTGFDFKPLPMLSTALHADVLLCSLFGELEVNETLYAVNMRHLPWW